MSKKHFKRFWGSIPAASDIIVTKQDGSKAVIRVNGKGDAAKTIRSGKK